MSWERLVFLNLEILSGFATNSQLDEARHALGGLGVQVVTGQGIWVVILLIVVWDKNLCWIAWINDVSMLKHCML